MNKYIHSEVIVMSTSSFQLFASFQLAFDVREEPPRVSCENKRQRTRGYRLPKGPRRSTKHFNGPNEVNMIDE